MTTWSSLRVLLLFPSRFARTDGRLATLSTQLLGVSVTTRAAQRERYSFGNLEEVLELPDLIAVQRESFQWLLDEGLAQTFRDISPIKDFSENLQLELDFDPFDPDLRPEPKYSVAHCRQQVFDHYHHRRDYH